MGGGDTKIEEAIKRLRIRDGTAGDGASGDGTTVDLTTSICERQQDVPVRLVVDGVGEGTAVRVVLGDPPALVSDGRTVARVADRRAAATLTACLNQGYEIIGQIVAVMPDRQAVASIVGVRS
jgi:hypothetical protein